MKEDKSEVKFEALNKYS